MAPKFAVSYTSAADVLAIASGEAIEVVDESFTSRLPVTSENAVVCTIWSKEMRVMLP